MTWRAIFFLCCFVALLDLGNSALAKSRSKGKEQKQVGFGVGYASQYPITGTTPMVAAVENTYRKGYTGLSILGMYVNSYIPVSFPAIGISGAGSVLIQIAVYLPLIHFGIDIGMHTVYSSSFLSATYSFNFYPAYGPMVGIEIPVGDVSMGIDFRYLWAPGAPNWYPLTALVMFRTTL